MEENPLLKQYDFQIETLFEDDDVLVVNKPSGLLSVRGKTDLYSVQQWFEDKGGDGPGLVHRLDMATSGIIVIAKTKEAHEHLQKQFLEKTIQKEYTAILDGIIEQQEGVIDFPIRPDLEDRPRQMLCYEHGKPSVTKYKVVDEINDKTLIRFYPITGRTHQLRVHAAHPNGLNVAILGDKLYGKPDKRLHLHASKITFKHPVTHQSITVKSAPNF